nr:MAG TPA: hypothetical protein [Caudoviricetes sp.]
MQPATSPRSNPEDCRGAAESRQSRDFGAFIRWSQGDGKEVYDDEAGTDR